MGGKNSGSKPTVLYTVYDNKSDLPVIVDGTARECAQVLGMSLQTFRTTVTRCCKGTNRRWTILKTPITELEELY